MDKLWTDLLDIKSLAAGWHLVRKDLSASFIEDHIHTEAFAQNLADNLHEMRRQLYTKTFVPNPIKSIDVPKGPLGLRPGSFLAVRDYTVLFGVVRLIAPQLDKLLPSSVYSYRLKDPPTKDSLFRESDFIEHPFLKRKTISMWADPFDPWYALWPEFDVESRSVIDEGYRYLCVTDIAGYFENISLPILRDLLLDHLPGEQRIINLVMDCLEAWAVKTARGFRPLRGIPQGNQVSSFLGNIFLFPLDQEFEAFARDADIRYFRYMDDIRVFCKEMSVARRCIFLMERRVRELHLNLQSSKTRILDETKNKEASSFLIDPRIEQLSELRKTLTHEKLKDQNFVQKVRRHLKQIAELGPANQMQRLVGSRTPLRHLALRAFRLWISIMRQIGDDTHLDSLFRQIRINPDYRLSKAFVTSLKLFPRKVRYARQAHSYIHSPSNVYPHQEADLIRACRYTARLDETWITFCKNKALQPDAYFYSRMQSCYLLGRVILKLDELRQFEECFNHEMDEFVLSSLTIPLAQFREENNTRIIRKLVLHSNSRVAMVGKHFRLLKWDIEHAQRFFAYVFEKHMEMRLCDYVGMLWYPLYSNNPKILERLLSHIDRVGPRHPVWDLRSTLEGMSNIGHARLERLLQENTT